MLQNMTLTAVVRTFVQWGIAKALSSAFGVAVITFLATEVGITVGEEQKAWIANIATGLLMGIVVTLVNQFGKHFAWINQFISLGLSRTGPGYVPNNADAVVVVANSGGADEVRSIDVPPVGANPEVDKPDGDWPRG